MKRRKDQYFVDSANRLQTAEAQGDVFGFVDELTDLGGLAGPENYRRLNRLIRQRDSKSFLYEMLNRAMSTFNACLVRMDAHVNSAIAGGDERHGHRPGSPLDKQITDELLPCYFEVLRNQLELAEIRLHLERQQELSENKRLENERARDRKGSTRAKAISTDAAA
jgi:hypothetical protein